MNRLTQMRRALICATMNGGGEPPILLNGYVANNLLHYWDGIINQGIGSPQLTEGLPWVDLTGNRSILLSDRAAQDSWVKTTYGSNGFNIGSNYRYCFVLKDIAIPHPEFTLEVRGMSSRGTDVGGLCSFTMKENNQPLVGIGRKASGEVELIFKAAGRWGGFVYTEYPHTSDSATITLTYKKGVMTLYIDGVKVDNPTPLPSLSVWEARYNGTDITTAGDVFTIATTSVQPANGKLSDSGYIQRIMIYDKALNADMVATNYQTDIERYGL